MYNSINTLAHSSSYFYSLLPLHRQKQGWKNNKNKDNFSITPFGLLGSVRNTSTVVDSPKLQIFKDKEFYLESEFLEWFSGFTDAEGNFNITLRKLNNNKYTSVMLTFQIGLHIDDLSVLEVIKEKLNCGHIFISGSKCNYFVNDKASLIQVILPIFNFVNLNSSKYFQFIIFEKAINLLKDKKHLTQEGKLEMLNLYYKLKTPYLAPSSKELNNSPLTLSWLGGFTDGDSTFSIANYKPRLKFDNHEKEIELFKRIQIFLNTDAKLNITKSRLNRPNSNPIVCLDITDIQFLKKNIVPIYSKLGILKSKKLKDFKD